MSTKNTSAAFSSTLVSRADDRPDATLTARMRAASEGNPDAAAAIAREHGQQLLDEARAALGPEHEREAEDVGQDLYVGMLEQCFTFRTHPEGPAGWLRSVVRSLAAQRATARDPSLVAPPYVTHDPQANPGYVYLVDPARAGRPTRSEMAPGGDVIFDLDEQGRIRMKTSFVASRYLPPHG
jgi:hypothetical protein